MLEVCAGMFRVSPDQRTAAGISFARKTVFFGIFERDVLWSGDTRNIPFGEELEYEKVRAKRQEMFNELVEKEGIQLKPGVKEILGFLRERGIVTAVATSTNIARTEVYLKELGLYDLFDRIISASMVERGKPAPDVYKYTCKELGLNPANCMAVEDSPNGIHSAYDAGCKVVMVPDQAPADEKTREILYGYEDSLLGLKKYFASF